MTIVQQTPNQMPSILACVQRVKRECGLPVPETLVSTADKTALVALDGLNEAAVDIYSRKRWEWQKSLYGMRLLANTTEYPLPIDFQRMAEDPHFNGVPVQGLTPEEWVQTVPGAGVMYGSPQFYTVSGAIFRLWPAPTQEIVDLFPILPYVYYRAEPAPIGGTDDAAAFNIPPEFLGCLIAYGKYKVREFLEYPDARDSLQLYEKLLFTRMNADKSMRRAARIRQSGVVRSKIWA